MEAPRVNLVFICTPGNTGSSILTNVFIQHAFATGEDTASGTARYPAGRGEPTQLKTLAKMYIKEHGGNPWQPPGCDSLAVGDDWARKFKDALLEEKLSGNIVLKSLYFLWLKEKMPPACWVLAYRNIDRAAASMLERLKPGHGMTLQNVRDRIESYYKAAERLCDYTIDVDDLVRGNPQALPEIIRACGVEYDSGKTDSIINAKLWRF